LILGGFLILATLNWNIFVIDLIEWIMKKGHGFSSFDSGICSTCPDDHHRERSSGLSYRLRTTNDTLNLDTTPDYDDVTGLGTPSGNFLAAVAAGH
jgi:hypothetical protein